MLNQIQGVSGSGVSSKQGGEAEENLKNASGRKGNVSSGLGEGKDKVEEDTEDGPMMTESERASDTKGIKSLKNSMSPGKNLMPKKLKSKIQN